jgi:tripeptide aminopeptidase
MTMPVKDAPFLEERTAAVMESVFNDPIVKKALEQAVPQEIFTIEEQIEICEVPAPPMKEQKPSQAIIIDSK